MDPTSTRAWLRAKASSPAAEHAYVTKELMFTPAAFSWQGRYDAPGDVVSRYVYVYHARLVKYLRRGYRPAS